MEKLVNYKGYWFSLIYEGKKIVKIGCLKGKRQPSYVGAIVAPTEKEVKRNLRPSAKRRALLDLIKELQEKEENAAPNVQKEKKGVKKC